ncbi:ribosome 60S biogenesis N-terminal-domain-containing protein [Chaetomium fimeti]|uniref:Ribosome 60S biogenesis N-terminal-domain-containing protein n=1 Tax=Chaetomium fimeti TaxID=1854472 RepID=A0AAE0LR48_9PEZI|nr:ribosome 60S biogenesis N-terminal-domain-containing protein [Chaetomium fimeti]
MGKRFTRGPDGAAASRKRQKVVHEAPTSEEIHASRQLQQLLSFSQDPVRARHGLQSFKLFLDDLLDPDSDHGDRPQILRDYLQFARPADDDDENTVCLPDMMQTWSYAAQINNDNIMSALPVVLALLLKLLSQSLETVPLGLAICRTLLQKRQQELIARNLAADKGKAFIISPTLRMLKEAVSFDGGAIARPLFRARASMLKSLARNMGIVHIGEEAEDTKRPSARTNAILFFLGALKFLHPEAKKELLSQRDIVSALTRDVKQDPPYLVRELLEGLRSHVLLDDKLLREAKANLLNTSTLTRLAALYQYRLGTPSEDETSIPDIAHEFLTTACTDPACGVLRHDSGFYPREIDPDTVIPTAELDDLGLEAIVWMNKFKTEVPVRNYTLSNFLPNLRPWSNVKQSELITSIFKVAPELVAHYFLTNKSFTFEPKLSATWIGYAAFLFNTVTLPVPDYFCRAETFRELPPPTSIVMDNILPLPLNQKALTRSLANKSNMISFFATRILVVAIEKLDAAIKMHHDAAHSNKSVWAEAARRLVDDFCQRSPGIKEMINSYRSIPEGDLLHREAGSRLLRLCYEVLPQVALMAKFDVSPFLETALSRLSKQELDDPRDFALSLKELENLLAIAGYSPGMRWFSASEGMSLSPFTLLLKVYVDAPDGVALEAIRSVLNFVAVEQQLVPTGDKHPGLLVLLEALQSLRQSSPDSVTQLWPFLDNCLTRCANTPVKYVEKMQEVIQNTTESTQKDLAGAVASPIAMAMLEQLPFIAAKEGGQATIKALGRFLPKFLGLSATAGESRPLLDAIFSNMVTHLADSKGKLAKAGVPKGLEFEHNPRPRGTETKAKKPKSTAASQGEEKSEPQMDAETLEDTLHVPDGLEADNAALVKWASKTVDELVDDGYLTSLIALLVSEHASIRKEALVNILKAAAKIKQSEYEEKEQIWLLLSELAETARDNINDGPLPSTIASFACHALNVLRDPLSSLYSKVNIFLTRGPVWSLDRLPLVDEILSEEPTVGDTYYAQVNWLLEYLIDGLRTPHDFELFHKKRAKGPVFERILALAANPYMRLPLRSQVLRLLYRATRIEGGSTTLTTRFGIVNWLDARQAGCTDAGEAAVHGALRRRIWETCDQDRVRVWSKGSLGVGHV